MSVTITFLGMPPGTTSGELENFSGDLIGAITKTGAPNLSAEKVKCFFLPSMMSAGLGEEIRVFVDGLLIASTMPHAYDIRKELSRRICWTTKMRFPDAAVECTIHPFDIPTGFWASNGQEHQ